MNRPAEEGSSRLFGQQGAETARLMIYLLLSIALMAMDQRDHLVPRLRAVLATAAEPFYAMVEWPQQALEATADSIRTRRALREENDMLRNELLRQAASTQRISALQQENARLRALLGATAGHRFEYRFAELSQVDLDPFSHRVLINQGSRDGVELGQAVIDGLGIVGQVDEVGPNHAQVRLISDPSHALPVQINRTGLRTVAYGRGDAGVLDLPSVPPQADVREGDLLVTSGLGDRFPQGYPVALVSAIERDSGSEFVRLEAQPLAALDRGREVLLVVPIEPATPTASAEPEAENTAAEAGADTEAGAVIESEATVEEADAPAPNDTTTIDDAAEQTPEQALPAEAGPDESAEDTP